MNQPARPPARHRSRAGRGARAAAAAAAPAPTRVGSPEPTEGQAAPAPAAAPALATRSSLIGDGPRQYLLGCEELAAFDAADAALDSVLQPADPIEQIWCDEILDLEWTLHRLRMVRRTALETALVDRLSSKAAMGTMRDPVLSRLGTENWRAAALGAVRGSAEAAEVLKQAMGHLRLQDEMRTVILEQADVMLRLDSSILAASRQRDAILSRLHGRRQLLAETRPSGASGS